MRSELTSVLENFRSNVQKIQDLMGFDKLLLKMIMASLEKIRDAQDRAGTPFKNPLHRVDSVIKFLEGIRQNESLSIHFETVYNQALVLLVSHFSAALRDAYKASVCLALKSDLSSQLLKEEVKITVADLLRGDEEPAERAADILIDKKDLSFQDMKSVGRAFEEVAGLTLSKDEDTNDIILSQACRHAIVHAGEVATEQTVRQVIVANPRNLKPALVKGEKILFSPEEVIAVSAAMDRYLVKLMEGVSKRYSEGA